ncbi:MAG: transglycosylase domain-containing protein, partial [Acidaminococcaceae bacterium]|nr:transglycosylase domain-containing protein [Acidaminococcaceae bacterium]
RRRRKWYRPAMNVCTVFKKTARCLLVIFFLAALLAGSAVAMLFYWASRDLPDLNRIAEYKQPQAAIFLARDGSLLGTLYHEKRFQITLKEMSRHVPLAFLAAEDDAFYHHMGGFGQFQKDFPVFFLFQVQGNALLITVHFHKPAGKIAPPGHEIPGVVTFNRFLNFNYIRPHIRKQAGTERAGQKP